MSKSLVLMIGFAVGFALFFWSCGGDDTEDLSSMDIPLTFLSRMAAGDYTVRVTITASDIPTPIVDEQNLAIVEGGNRTYEITVSDVPVGDQREVNVEVFKGRSRLFVGSDTVNISSGENQRAIELIGLLIINISPSAAVLGAIGATMQLSSTVKDEENQIVPDATVNWSSSNPSVANVSSQGRVTARGKGTAIITATTSGKASDTAEITVAQEEQEEPGPITINITPASATLEAIGTTMQPSVTVKDEKNQIVPDAIVNWSSSNPSVASVISGLVTARGNGTATITARSGNEYGTAEITVAQVPDTIKITPAGRLRIVAGQSQQLSATVCDSNNNPIAGAEVRWESQGPSIATVNSTGLVTAKGDGQTNIIASSSGLSQLVTITVPDTIGPSIVSGTVSDEDERVDVGPINAGGFRFDFDEPIIGSIKLTDEAGKNLNWTSNVLGQTATLTVVPGQELVNGRTYKIEIDVRDSANNTTKQTITFVTNIKR